MAKRARPSNRPRSIAPAARLAGLKQTLGEYRSLVEQIPAVTYVALVDEPRSRIYASPQLQPLLGFSAEEIAGDPGLWFRQVHPDDQARVLAEFAACVSSGGPFRSEYRLLTRAGQTLWVRDEAVLVRDRAGRPDLLKGLLRDITERHHAQEQLREGEARFRALMDEAYEGVVIDDDGVILETNPAFAAMLGREVATIIGQRVAELGEAEDQARYEAYVRSGLEGTFEAVVRCPDGTPRHLEVVAQYVTYQGRRVRMAAIRDITDRKAAEAALRASEERLRQLVQHAADIITVFNERGVLTYASPSLERVLGYPWADWVGHNPLELIHPEEVAVLRQALDQARAGATEVRLEFRVRHADGRWITLEAVGVNLLDTPGINGIVVTSRDVTERRQVEAAERAQRRLADALRDTASALNSTLDFEEVIARILDNVGRVVPHRGATLGLLSDGRVRFAKGRGYYADQSLDWLQSELSLEEIPNLREMAATGQPCRIADTRAYPEWVVLPETTWVRSYLGAPIHAQDRVIGFINLDSDQPNFFSAAQADHLQTFADQAAVALENARLLTELEHAYDETIEGWSRAMDLRDKETEGHTRRVAELTVLLARTLGLPEEAIVHLRRGALLHDIGKMGVPDAILLKPGPLTDAEWAVMRQHPVLAYEMLLPTAYLRPALDIPYSHHEKWDGTGYPRQLQGEAIPLAARIFAVADVWDALRSDRHYRPAWTEEQVREHIRALAGTHFDPRVVAAFLQVGRLPA